jgi:drug/metabolite transporter (DMT)-like permease
LGARLFQPWERVRARDLGWIALYALFGVIINQLLFMSGLRRTTATNAVVLSATIPVFTAMVAVLFRREAASLGRALGLALALSGALVIVGTESWGRWGSGHVVGNLLIIANSLSYSIYLVLTGDLLRRYRALTVISWTMAFGALGVVPLGITELYRAWPTLGFVPLVELGYIVLFPTVTAYFLNAFALARAPASLVAIYIYLQPLFGALLAAIRLGERPGPSVVVGGLLIAGGIAVVTRR